MIDWLPRPLLDPDCTPQWNSVALFFNLTAAPADLPREYATTAPQDAKEWLDEGTSPMSPGLGEFLCRYWSTLSLGNLAFGMDTPRRSGDPIVMELPEPPGGPDDWGALIRACLDAEAESIWRASGGLVRDGMRWIPSLVLVQNYRAFASAGFGGFDRTVGGTGYRIGDVTHIRFNLDTWSPPDRPTLIGRRWWGTLCHEYAHNFLEFGDLYGPQGCTGYWDLLGDNSPPGRMSEVSSLFKERIGWLSFTQIIQGPSTPPRDLALRPYTTTGDAIKFVPDPEHTPWEFFLLEYRTSTGPEVWRPDGALPSGGLFITHVNQRFGGVAGTWLLREAPYWDPEFADFSHSGATDWTGHDNLENKTYPEGSNDSFTAASTPNSNLYGNRDSGLSITNIRSDGNRVRFRLAIDASHRVGWTVGADDRGLAGNFTDESSSGGEEVFIRNGNAAAVLVHRQAQWLVARRQDDWIDGWNLGTDNYEAVGDFDGDGRHEIYIRSPNWAGILKYRGGRMRAIVVQHDWIDGWNLGSDNYELVGDFDGDGRDEIYVRSPDWAGVIELSGRRLRLSSIQHDWIDGWNLGADNTEFVGRFSRTDRDEVAIRSPEWIGLFRWDATRPGMRLASIQHDWVDGWNLGPNDRHVIGDFDGDGRDEIYIRSDNWAGVLKWSFGRFRVIWMTRDGIDHINADPSDSQPLEADDVSYAGRFRFDRDGVLHRNGGGLAVLAWTGTKMRVHKRLGSPFNPGHWNLGRSDNFVLGDFHRSGPDVVDAPNDLVIDGLTDVFIHNAWGTGMVGVNHGPVVPGGPAADYLDQMGLTWIQQRYLMEDR
jgi:hypothetical protein